MNIFCLCEVASVTESKRQLNPSNNFGSDDKIEAQQNVQTETSNLNGKGKNDVDRKEKKKKKKKKHTEELVDSPENTGVCTIYSCLQHSILLYFLYHILYFAEYFVER